MTIYRSEVTAGGHILRKVNRNNKTTRPKPGKVKSDKLPKVELTEKPCPHCKKTFSIEEFKSKSGKKQYHLCLECRRKESKRRMRARKVFDPSYVREYIIGVMGGKCIRCTYDEFVGALEFHHIDRSIKENAMSRLINQFAYGGTQTQWDAVEREALKCAILCSNCHQTYHQGAWSNIDELSRKNKRPTIIPMPRV